MQEKQLVNPNLNQTGSVGMCQQFAREMFGAPEVTGVEYAWQAWERCKDTYTDQNFPSGAAVLVWFSYMLNNVNEGHVAVWVPGQGFYCSPYTTRPNAQYQNAGATHALLPSIAEMERIYGVTYVGRSDDINGVRVAEADPVVEAAAPVAPTAPKAAPDTSLITHLGTATVTSGPIHVRTAPSTNATMVADYVVGQTFNYDSYIITDGYVWLSYVSTTGQRHYVAEGPNDGNTANVWVTGGVN